MSSAVWTPVQRPPSLGNHDILSSDGCIVMRALREQYEQALGMINRRNRGFDTRIRQHASGNMEYCNSERGISPALQTNNAHNVGNITGIYFHNGDVVDYAAQDKRHHSIEIKLEDVESLASAQQAGHIMEVDSVNQEMPFVEQVNKANIVSGKGFTETCSDVEAITLSATQSIATFEPCRKQAVCSESKKAWQDRSARFEGLRESARQLDRDHPKSCTVTGPPVRSSCSFGIRPLKQCKIEDFGFQSENVAKSKIVGFRSEIVAKNKDCRHEDKNKFCNDGINLLEDHTNVRTPILRSELSIQSYTSRQSGDGELQEVENLINQSNLTSRAITGSQKVSFKVPFKKQTKVRVIKPETVSSLLSSSSSSSSATPTTSQLLHGDQIDESTRSKVTDWVQSSEELCLTLVYRNKSTQLREVRVPPGKRKNKLDDENGRREIGYVMAILLQEDHDPCDKDDLQSSKCRVIKLVFDSVDKEYTAWARELTKCVMSQRTRKICYDGQELAYQFIKHYKFDNQEVCTQWCFLDVKIASWVLDPDNPPQQFEDVTESLKLQPQSTQQGNDTVCEDLSMLSTAVQKLYTKLKAVQLWDLFINLEMRLCPILAVMEREGVKISVAKLAEFTNVLRKKLQDIEKRAHETAGHPFVLSSHAQTREVLFNELKLDEKYQGSTKLARTQVNNFKSTSESVLQHLQDLHPLPRIILEHRQIMKLKSTYVDGILSFVENGYLYTTWQHTAAATGRLTSANPNIQNIPKQPCTVTVADKIVCQDKEDTMYTILAREPFISEDGRSFVAADFQSIELRLLAHLSEDPTLLAVFQKPDCNDIFAELASQWLNKPASEIEVTERERTKRVVYSVVYGVGKDRLADTLSVTADEAKEFINSFLGKFPALNTFTKKTIECCHRHGYAVTMFRRRRLFPHIHSTNYQLRSQAERQAVNFIVQGSAADICKAAMIQIVHQLSQHSDIQARLLYQIHDELLFEVKDRDVTAVQDVLKTVMESTDTLCGHRVKLKVPLRVTLSVGKSWAHMAEVP